MHDLEPREQAELDRLAGERIGSGDDRLAGDDRRRRRQKDHRHEPPARGHEIEGILHRLRVVQDQRALAEIVADQRRQDEEQPRRLDRAAAEMTHIGVERLGPRHREEDAAENDKTHRPLFEDEGEARQGIQGLEDLPGRRDLDDAQRRVGREEHHHDRTEEGGDARCAAALRGEEKDENDHRRWQNVGREIGVDLLQPLERGKDRYRRRDHGVAGKEGRSRRAEQEGDRRALAERPLGEGLQRQDAAFALVVGLHEKQDVFSRDDDQERPDNQGNDADHVARPEPRSLELAERGLKGVQGTRADVSEHDPDRTEGENPEMLRGIPVARRLHPGLRQRGRVLRDVFGHLLQNPRGVMGRTPQSGGRLYSLDPRGQRAARSAFRIGQPVIRSQPVPRGGPGGRRSPLAVRSRECGRRRRRSRNATL